MKILNTAQFVTERVKIKPVTSAEWDKVQYETKSPMLHELPLEYENLFKEGNLVFIEDIISGEAYHPGTDMQAQRQRFTSKYVVISRENYNAIFTKLDPIPNKYDYVLCGVRAALYFKPEDFKHKFPNNELGNYAITKIIDAGIDFKYINSVDDLSKMFTKYRNIN